MDCLHRTCFQAMASRPADMDCNWMPPALLSWPHW